MIWAGSRSFSRYRRRITWLDSGYIQATESVWCSEHTQTRAPMSRKVYAGAHCRRDWPAFTNDCEILIPLTDTWFPLSCHILCHSIFTIILYSTKKKSNIAWEFIVQPRWPTTGRIDIYPDTLVSNTPDSQNRYQLSGQLLNRRSLLIRLFFDSDGSRFRLGTWSEKIWEELSVETRAWYCARWAEGPRG